MSSKIKGGYVKKKKKISISVMKMTKVIQF